jgi:hypothetical protein
MVRFSFSISGGGDIALFDKGGEVFLRRGKSLCVSEAMWSLLKLSDLSNTTKLPQAIVTTAGFLLHFEGRSEVRHWVAKVHAKLADQRCDATRNFLQSGKAILAGLISRARMRKIP